MKKKSILFFTVLGIMKAQSISIPADTAIVTFHTTQIKNTKVEIVRTKNIPRRDNDHVLFNFSKFHNNNIIQRIVLVGPVVNYECGSFAVDPCFTTRKRNNV